MKALILAGSILLMQASGAIAQGIQPPSDLTTRSGQTYKAARVFRAEPDGITYMFAGGMVKIPFTDLPQTVQKQYGYDPKAAQVFAEADDQIQQRAFQAGQAALAEDARKQQASLEVAAKHATDDSYHARNDAPMPGQPKAVVDPSWQGGLKSLAKASVLEVSTSPFTLQNELVEMDGIRHVEKKEISAGVYRMTIWGKDTSYVEATLPGKQAFNAEKSKTLFVAVKDPSSTPPEIVILGNGTMYKGLSTMPTVIWK